MGDKEKNEGYQKGADDAKNERGNRNTTDALSAVLGRTDREDGYKKGYEENKK